MANASILIVDDDSVSRTLLTKLVVRLGYDVLAASDGLEAQKVLNQHAVDVIIADYDMPGLNGLELLKWVSAEFPSLPFILVTAYSNIKVIGEAWENGAFDFFEKPVFVDRLKQTTQIAVEFGQLKIARRRFPPQTHPDPDPHLLDLTVLRELAAALDAPDLTAIVAEYDVHARVELEQILRFNHARQFEAARKTAHRLAGTSVNLGLSKISQEFRRIEADPQKPIARPEELDEMLAQSLHWLKFHLSDILQDLAS
jgi:CheY-like chemotaxis protein